LPELSVVIPTYRRRDALPRTLAALERQTVDRARFEVIVVDDPVEDDSPAVADLVAAGERPFETRQLHREERGVSAARNAGWRAARAPLVMFLGDDILPAPDALAEHLAWHERHPEEEVAVLGHVTWARELRPTLFMRWLERGVQFDYGVLTGDEAAWTHFYTSNVSLKRALLERAGGFDEQRFPFLYEDIELGYRLREQGMRLLYNRRAAAEHLHATTVDEWRGRMAATAEAERRWVELRPEMEAHFKQRFEMAADGIRLPRAVLAAPKLIPPGTPLIGNQVWKLADRYFLQQLAPDYLSAWAGAGARRR
jgi:GT2 family glycosyltransferase